MSLQLKENNFYFDDLHMVTSNITLIPIHSNDRELFRKCREIWNKINELLVIDDPTDFVRTTLYDDEFFMLDVH